MKLKRVNIFVFIADCMQDQISVHALVKQDDVHLSTDLWLHRVGRDVAHW